jgi:predicted phage-related endonuclease
VSAKARPRVDLDDDVRPWVDAYRDLSRQINALEQQRARAREHIEAAMADAEEGVIDGLVQVRWTVVESKRLNQAKLRETAPELCDAFTTVSYSRRFTVEDPA